MLRVDKLKSSGTLLMIASVVLCCIIAVRLFSYGDWALGLGALILALINLARNTRERVLLDKMKNMKEWRTSGNN